MFFSPSESLDKLAEEHAKAFTIERSLCLEQNKTALRSRKRMTERTAVYYKA